MALLVGIDEAGYGPLLGPLVVSASAFSLPDHHLNADLWALLSTAVGRDKRRLAGRLLITDSKKAYHRSAGPAVLQRTVLAMLAVMDGSPTLPQNGLQLIERLSPETPPRLRQYPWYADLDRHPLFGDPEDISLAAKVLRRALAAHDMRYMGTWCRVLDVASFNHRVEVVRNKASVLFTEVCTLIQQAFDALPAGETLQVIADRQGGRVNYRKVLACMFPRLELRILKEHPLGSSYELTGTGRSMRLHFAVKADFRFLPVALASMTGKALREVLVEAINRYFLRHCDGVAATAGYWQDGQRFIRELEAHPGRVPYDPEQLIRKR
jgi:hypothetical protein